MFSFFNKTKGPSVRSDWVETTSQRSGNSPKRARRTSGSSTSSNNNIYSTLEDNVDGTEPETSRKTKRAKRSIAKPQKSELSKEPSLPPITVKNIDVMKLNTALDDSQMQAGDIYIRITQYGIKMFANNKSNFSKLKEHLLAKKFEFYTHQLK